MDIGPAVGAAPYLIPNLDTKSDIFDLNVFTRNWLWSADNRTLSRINSTPSSFEHQISFSVEDNRISIVVPGSITSGRIQLEHNAHQTKMSC